MSVHQLKCRTKASTLKEGPAYEVRGLPSRYRETAILSFAGFTWWNFLEYFILPVATTAVTAVVRRLTRWTRWDRNDAALGLDLMVGALFAVVLVALIDARHHMRPLWDWIHRDTLTALAALLLLCSTGVIVRGWGWQQIRQRTPELVLVQGIIIPLVGSVLALLLVVRIAA